MTNTDREQSVHPRTQSITSTVVVGCNGISAILSLCSSAGWQILTWSQPMKTGSFLRWLIFENQYHTKVLISQCLLRGCNFDFLTKIKLVI